MIKGIVQDKNGRIDLIKETTDYEWVRMKKRTLRDRDGVVSQYKKRDELILTSVSKLYRKKRVRFRIYHNKSKGT